MKYLLLVMALVGCGYSSRNNEMIGQVKKVNENTPIICPDYKDADVSLGVIRNGVGSMSSQDVWLYVPSEDNYKLLKQANESGSLVKIKYDVERVVFCREQDVVTSVEIVK